MSNDYDLLLSPQYISTSQTNVSNEFIAMILAKIYFLPLWQESIEIYHLLQDNYTPLILASKNGHVEAVKRLCEGGKANVDLKAGWVRNDFNEYIKKFQ